MRNKPIRKQFRSLSSGWKTKPHRHDQSISESHPVCHGYSPSKRTVFKTGSFQKRFSGPRAANKDSPGHWNTRIFSFRKKNKLQVEKFTDSKVDDNVLKIGIKTGAKSEPKSYRSNAFGKLQKRKYKAKRHKGKLKTSNSEEGNKYSLLERAFSLRLKSRTDSHSEKIDLSSLIKVVNFQKTGRKLAGKQTTETPRSFNTALFRDSCKPALLESPTCFDMYGADEEVTSNLEMKPLSGPSISEVGDKNTNMILEKSAKLTAHTENENAVRKLNVAESENGCNISKDKESHRKYETYSNLTFHFDKSVKPLGNNNSFSVANLPSSMPDIPGDKHVNSSTQETVDIVIPALKKITDSNNCDIVIENFGNPWVLKSDFQEKRTDELYRSVSKDSPVSYESLGFDINCSGADKSLLSPKSARRSNGRVLKRSASVESLDSFNSSLQSIKSEECLFSSDSEEEIGADTVSISSSDSFASAKDYTDKGELDIDFVEKIRKASSLDSLDNVHSPVDDKVKTSDSFVAYDTTPILNSMKHTYSVDDVHRIIQRPNSLSLSKGFSLDSASKGDKTPKSDRKSERNKRRSLDSSFKTADKKFDFKTEFDKQNLTSASSDSGLSSVLSPVQENGDVKLRSHSNVDPHNKMFYTLPNPRKPKSYPPLLPKKKPTRIGSLSKMLSDKAESFSGLRLGTSFKLRNLEKPLSSGLNKTKSLTSLMSKTGSAVVSSISSLIKGKSTSDASVDMVDSPFKPRSKKARKTKEEENEFVYEKVKVLVPRKRPVNAQELVAERKRLTLDLKLANIKQNESDINRARRKGSEKMKITKGETVLSSPESGSFIGSVHSPTMLDEIMKSVDTRRFSIGLALDIGDISDTDELDDTSSKSSSTRLLMKKRSVVSDITTPGSVFLCEDYFSVCPRCQKMKHCLDTMLGCNEIGEITFEKRTHSLMDVNSCCVCLKLSRNHDMGEGCIEYGDQMISSTPCSKRQSSVSLQELRYLTDIPFQNYVDLTGGCVNGSEIEVLNTEVRKPKLKARRSLPYTLPKYQPCLDLSADDLDEIGSAEEDTGQNLFQKGAEKSHSCSDLLDNTKEADAVIYSERPLERKPSKRGDRPIKVKSLSSSHDALTCLTSVDIPDIDVCVENGSQIGRVDKQKSDYEFKQFKTEVKKDTEESEDSGNEDYHSVGSEAEKIDLENNDMERNDTEILEDAKISLENSLDSGLTLPDSQGLLSSFQNLKMVCENFTVGSNKQTCVPATNKRQSYSVTDLRLSDCDNMNRLAVKNKSISVSKLSDINNIRKNCEFNEKLDGKAESQKLESISHVNEVTETDTQSLHMHQDIPMTKSHKFLFDDQHIKTYKTVEGMSRLKSVSSDNVTSKSYLGTETPLKSSSALSIDKLKPKKSPNYIHDKLCIDLDRAFFPPELSPLHGMFSLPPFQGFSAFSPPAGGELPELEEVYKYDICLGYLMHSIKCDNKTICVYSLQRNKQLMEGVITPISGLPGAPHTRPSESSHGNKQKSQKKPKDEDMPNPAAPITVVPSEKLSHAGHVLRTVLLSRASHMIRDRKFHLRTYRRCMVGTEMVDWLLQQSTLVHSRTQAVGMWQALVEEGVVVHVCHEHQFKDKYLFYRFREDDQGVSTVPSSVSKKECEDELQEVFLMLAQIGPDAMMRMILRKLPHERTVEDLEIIYEELLHIKALSHLSTMVKRELASVLVFESHAKSGTVLFNQGDEGKSWYIILKGSVNVVIYGKGVVCTLHEGDDFGKLALVNDAPRAATIVLRDDNCHFLRVDKDDFNRILRDVEANTVRLKEHGQDVLVLEKIPTNTQSADGTVQAHYKYSIMAGTPEKMLEHLLETRLDSKGEEELGMFRDGFLEDFLLTHVIFMPCNHLCPVLLSHYHSSMSDSTEQENFEYMLNHKKCVLHFVQEWSHIVGDAFKEDHTINAFLEELHSCVLEDQQSYTSLRDDAFMLENILEAQTRLSENQLLTNSGTIPTLSRKTSKDNLIDSGGKTKVIKATDENLFKVYCADHTYCTLRLPMDATVEQILSSARDKLCLGDDLILCEVKSTGERISLKENDLCVTSGLSINGRLFITPREHLDALTPLPEQEGPPQGSVNTIELVSSREMAYYMTVYDWELFSCVQEYELIFQVFGRYKFRKITANLDLFLRRFNEIQFWVVTEMVLATNLSKRVALLRKFIKLASYCKDYQNLNSFFAIVMGLSNIAVSRLSQTWEKLPGKFKKMFADFETLMDPSRNHRVYRLSVAKMVPPIIPFMPLLMKDMTFTHEGNKTYFDGLVNFEKMHMIAQTLKTVRFCRSSNLELEAPSTMKSADISQFIKNLHVIDNQRHLTQLSHKLEPRKT